MLDAWSRHDAGCFSLECPPGWTLEQPNAATLLLRDPRLHLRITLAAASRSPGRLQSAPRGRSPAAESQAELQKWLGQQPGVEFQQRPRILPGTSCSTAAVEGLQRLGPSPAARPWYLRLLPRPQSTLLWRYWAVVNPHVLLLVSAVGKPSDIERHRPALDRLIQSIHLPERDILIGRRFTETVVSLARSWFPQTAVTVIDDVHLQFGTRNVSLLHLHRRYLASPEDLTTQVHAFLCAVQGELPASVLINWPAARSRILPTFLTRTAVHNHASRLVHEPWVNGLAITYILDPERSSPSPPDPSSPTSPMPPPDAAPGDARAATDLKTQDSSQLLHAGERPITLDDLERWNISLEELHNQALQNLIVNSHEHTMQGQKGDGFTMLCLGGNPPSNLPGDADRHNAARILLPELHRKLREHLGATFFAAIPTRDLLLAFSASDPAVFARVREQIAADFSHSLQGLSPKLFLITPDGITGDPHDEEDLIL